MCCLPFLAVKRRLNGTTATVPPRLDRSQTGAQYGCAMDFGFALPGRGPLATPDVLVKLAHKAEALRYSSIFVTDHVVIPMSNASAYPYSPTGKCAPEWTECYLEPLPLMCSLAGEATRLRLATRVRV